MSGFCTFFERGKELFFPSLSKRRIKRVSPSVSATLVETRKLCIGFGGAWRADRSAHFFSWSIALYGQFVPYLRYTVNLQKSQ